MAAAFVVENKLVVKKQGFERACSLQFQVCYAKFVHCQRVVPAQVARLDRWWYVEKAKMRSRWYEEFYQEYSICISLNSRRPYYWDPLPGMVQSLASHRRCFRAPPASYTPIWLDCRQECQVEVRKGGDTDGPATFKPTVDPYQAFLTPC